MIEILNLILVVFQVMMFFMYGLWCLDFFERTKQIKILTGITLRAEEEEKLQKQKFKVKEKLYTQCFLYNISDETYYISEALQECKNKIDFSNGVYIKTRILYERLIPGINKDLLEVFIHSVTEKRVKKGE